MRKKTLIFSTLLGLLAWMFGVNFASAAALSSVSDKLSRLQQGPVTAKHTVTFTTATVLNSVDALGGGDKIKIDLSAYGTFANNTDISGNVTLKVGGTPRTLAAVIGSGDTASVTSKVLTIQLSTGGTNPASIAATSVLEVVIGSTSNVVTNPAAANNVKTTVTTTTSANVTKDTGSAANSIVANDQVAVSATIEPTMTFTLSGNTVSFAAALSTTPQIATQAITVGVSTNAGSGYTVYTQDVGDNTNPGLFASAAPSSADRIIGSASNTYAPGPVTLATGVEGYGICGKVTLGAATVAARYTSGANTCDTDNVVGGLAVSAVPMFSNTAATASDQVTVYTKAVVSSTNAAGAYSDTLTYTVTGTF